MNSVILMLMPFLLMTLTLEASANYHCQGNVIRVGISGGDNSLNVDNGNGVHVLCSLSEQHPNAAVDQTACRAWYTGILASNVANRPITISYLDSTGKDSSACSQVGNWVWPDDKVYHITFN